MIFDDDYVVVVDNYYDENIRGVIILLLLFYNPLFFVFAINNCESLSHCSNMINNCLQRNKNLGKNYIKKNA